MRKFADAKCFPRPPWSETVLVFVQIWLSSVLMLVFFANIVKYVRRHKV